MKTDSVPIVGELFAAGPSDRVFDSLLLAGPLLIVFVALVGRSLLTTLLTVSYLATFIGYTFFKATTES
ncbi:hypothetical protein [Halorussus salinisoli]|uniref:hypothetical protein n=1 Tax=Halorussus salinisoli TaxID=2558242 RepID=UPI0010C1E970|nr:hypothetical protein [Halorussus salinisoli]